MLFSDPQVRAFGVIGCVCLSKARRGSMFEVWVILEKQAFLAVECFFSLFSQVQVIPVRFWGLSSRNLHPQGQTEVGVPLRQKHSHGPGTSEARGSGCPASWLYPPALGQAALSTFLVKTQSHSCWSQGSPQTGQKSMSNLLLFVDLLLLPAPNPSRS